MLATPPLMFNEPVHTPNGWGILIGRFNGYYIIKHTPADFPTESKGGKELSRNPHQVIVEYEYADVTRTA